MNTKTMEDEIGRLRRQISAHEIGRLRRQISALEHAENGASSSEQPAATGYSTSTLKNFTVPQDESQQAPSKGSGTKRKKCISLVIGMTLIAAVVGAVVALKDFMKKGDIQFVQDGPGTASITPEEMAIHNTEDDCWIVLYGDVYDLTNYARRHPGGARIVTDLAGSDGTAQYEHFHSEALLRSVQGDIVGTLVDGSTNGGGGGGVNTGGGGSNNGVGVGGGAGTTVVDCSTVANCVTATELGTHNTADDCWIALHGNVYDLTEYARRHPGGASVVTQLAGTDGTNEYSRFHSKGLLADVRNTLIGPYEGGTEAGGNTNQGGQMDSADSED
jgi:cytochrome b involved in lipid metabolism